MVVGGHPRVAAGWRPAQRHVPERHRADGEAGGPRSLPPPQARLPPPGDAPGGTQAPCPPPRVARSPLPGELRGAGPTGSAGLTFAELARKRLGELTPRSGRSVPPRLCPFLGLPSSDSACRTRGPSLWGPGLPGDHPAHRHRQGLRGCTAVTCAGRIRHLADLGSRPPHLPPGAAAGRRTQVPNRVCPGERRGPGSGPESCRRPRRARPGQPVLRLSVRPLCGAGVQAAGLGVRPPACRASGPRGAGARTGSE